MAKTETVRIRLEPALKAEGEDILSTLGLSTTEAVTLFFRQIVMRRGLPFEARIPNDETLEAFREARETPARLLRYPDGKTAVAEMLKD